jgi:hypothetical protein
METKTLHELNEAIVNARIIRVPWIFGYSATTIGNTIFLVSKKESSELLLHEAVHLYQYKEYGTLRFLYRYMKEYLSGLVAYKSMKQAYKSNVYEIEARENVTHVLDNE